MCQAFGIVNFEGMHVKIQGMQEYRPAGAMSFLGRYRLIDFPISNLTNSGIHHIQVHIKDKPRSLMEHLGTGRHYNISSKRGKLHILPANDEIYNACYKHDISSYLYHMDALSQVKEPYVVIVPSHMVYRMDFASALAKHIESKADVTMLYKTVENAKTAYLDCDVLYLNREKQVLRLEKNRGSANKQNISMETYIMKTSIFLQLVKKASEISTMYSFSDMLQEACRTYHIQGMAHRGYFACIHDFQSYYDANMGLLDYDKAMDLFLKDWPIYTRTNDSCPTQYAPDAQVRNSYVSNGCYIEGTVENCIIGRGCRIGKHAVVKNCIISLNSVIEEGVHMEHVVVDKNAYICKKKQLQGDRMHPIYIKKGDRV